MNKKLTLVAVFCVSSSLHSMQNILDYIQKYGKPAAEKTINKILLQPRILSSQFKLAHREGILIPYSIAVSAIQFLAPGYLLYLHANKLQEQNIAEAVRTGNIGLIKSFLATGYDVTQFPNLLHQAVMYLQPASVKILLEKGLNIDALDFTNHTAENYAEIEPTDNAQQREKKREIQKIFRIYKAKRNLAPQIQNLLHKKAARPIIQASIEDVSQAPEGYRGAHDISGIIGKYL